MPAPQIRLSETLLTGLARRAGATGHLRAKVALTAFQRATSPGFRQVGSASSTASGRVGFGVVRLLGMGVSLAMPSRMDGDTTVGYEALNCKPRARSFTQFPRHSTYLPSVTVSRFSAFVANQCLMGPTRSR